MLHYNSSMDILRSIFRLCYDVTKEGEKKSENEVERGQQTVVTHCMLFQGTILIYKALFFTNFFNFN